MAHYIFNDIVEFKQSVSGAANMSLDMQSIEAKINLVARRHLFSWLGKAQWEKLVDDFADLSTEEEALLPYVQKVIAPLALAEYSKIAGVQFTDNGLMRTESDHYKSAYKNQENAYRQSMIDDGYEAIEWMLEFLWDKEADYPLWSGSKAAQRSRALVINTVEAFREHYMHSISRYTYNLLRPLMVDIEVFALLPCLGKTYFYTMKSKILAGTFTDPHELELLEIIQKAIANYTIEEGMRRHVVQIQEGVVVQTEKLEPQSYLKEGPPNARNFAIKTTHHEEFANRLMGYLKDFLTENIELFPEYKAFVEEEEAEAAAENLDTECADAYFFKSCGCRRSCSCKGNDAVVNL